MWNIIIVHLGTIQNPQSAKQNRAQSIRTVLLATLVDTDTASFFSNVVWSIIGNAPSPQVFLRKISTEFSQSHFLNVLSHSTFIYFVIYIHSFLSKPSWQYKYHHYFSLHNKTLVGILIEGLSWAQRGKCS